MTTQQRPSVGRIVHYVSSRLRWWRWGWVNWARRLLGLPKRCRPIPCPPFTEVELRVEPAVRDDGDRA